MSNKPKTKAEQREELKKKEKKNKKLGATLASQVKRAEINKKYTEKKANKP